MGFFWFLIGQQAAKEQARIQAEQAEQAEQAITEVPSRPMTQAERLVMDKCIAGGFLFLLIGSFMSAWVGGCIYKNTLGTEEGTKRGCTMFVVTCILGPPLFGAVALFGYAVFWSVRTLLFM